MSDLDDHEFDDLFDYDIDNIETTFDTSNPGESSNAAGAPSSAKSKGKDDKDLGVDEEIKIRKRKPIVKLTEERLLGPDGIPYIQEHAAKKIKFKGKGHEVSDLGRLLKFYQIWADNLYPKAQFKDVVSMLEKLGSSRSMQNKREEWVEQYRMQRVQEDERLIGQARELLEKESGSVFIRGEAGESSTGVPKDSADAGDAAALTREQANKDAGDSLFFRDDDDDDLDELDELDAIMKEAEKSTAPPARAAPTEDLDDDDMDELDAIMKEMEGNSGDKPPTPPAGKPKPKNIVVSDDEFEEAMAAMRENET
ncbi:hypothetical protein ABW19_dt0205706 [Dactylella cylindrospora]|nr:hypothetical protein ABW19_dt0205706 [Dactylella cylindrospora]